MKKVAGIILPIFLIVFYFVLPADLDATAVADTASSYDGVKVVSPSAFMSKISQLIVMMESSIDSIAIPLASTMLAICAVVFIVGLFTGIHFVRRIGFLGVILVGVGLLVLYGRSLFLGLIQALTNYMST